MYFLSRFPSEPEAGAADAAATDPDGGAPGDAPAGEGDSASDAPLPRGVAAVQIEPGARSYFLQLSVELAVANSIVTSNSLSLSSPFLSLPGVKLNLVVPTLPMPPFGPL